METVPMEGSILRVGIIKLPSDRTPNNSVRTGVLRKRSFLTP